MNEIILLNSLPNSVLLAGMEEGESRQVTLWPERVVRQRMAMGGVTSAIGHQATAELFSKRLGLDIQANRINVEPRPGDCVIAGLFQTPRRLAEGEMWSEQEILQMPVQWVFVKF